MKNHYDYIIFLNSKYILGFYILLNNGFKGMRFVVLPANENLVEMHILECCPRATESETVGRALKALQIIMMHAKVLILKLNG